MHTEFKQAILIRMSEILKYHVREDNLDTQYTNKEIASMLDQVKELALND